MKFMTVFLFTISILVVGCSENNNQNNGTESSGNDGILKTGLSLNITGGKEVTAESLICIYRQEFGSSNSLFLDLQYLGSPNEVAFALYIENPIPATPYVVSAGQQGKFHFEVFSENAGYNGDLTAGEIEVSLDNLPSPSSLSDGELVSLKGSLLINMFTLPEASSADDSAYLGLELDASNININCETEFQLSEVVI